MPNGAIGDLVISRLSVHLGPNVSKMAVKAFAKKAGVHGPEELTAAHLPALVEDIHPMLNVMIGKGPADAVVADIARTAGR